MRLEQASCGATTRIGAIAGVVAGVLVIAWGTLDNAGISIGIAFPSNNLLVGFFGTAAILIVGTLVSSVTSNPPPETAIEH